MSLVERGTCGECERKNCVLNEDPLTRRGVCGLCMQKANKLCSQCGKVATVDRSSLLEGKPICTPCAKSYPQRVPRAPCSNCGKDRPAARRFRLGWDWGLCDTCLNKEGSKLGKCHGCDDKRPIEIFTEDERVFCLACSLKEPGEYKQCWHCKMKRVVHSFDVDERPCCLGCYRMFTNILR